MRLAILVLAAVLMLDLILLYGVLSRLDRALLILSGGCL